MFALALGFACGLPAQSRASSSAQPKDLLDLVPDGAWLVLSTANLGELWDSLAGMFLPLPGVVGERYGPQIGIGKVALTAALGVSIDDLVRTFSRQVVFAIVPTSRGPAPLLLASIADDQHARLEAWKERLGGKLALAFADGHVRASDRAEVLDSLRPATVSSPRAANPRRGLRAEVNLSSLRTALARGRLLWTGLDAGGRFLVGPLAGWFDGASTLSAELHFAEHGRGLTAALTVGSGKALEGHPSAVLLATDVAKVVPVSASDLGRVGLGRSLSALFQHARTLLSEDDAAKLESSLSIADALVGGRSVVKDLLPALGPLALHVTQADPQGDSGPRITLPGFVLSVPVASERAQKMLVTLFKNLATVQAMERAQAGKVPFALEITQVEGLRLHTLSIPEWNGVGAPPFEVAASPTLILAHGHAIVASTSKAALQIARALASSEREEVAVDEFVVRGQALSRLVLQNAKIVALGRLLDEGESLEPARWFTKALADVLGAVAEFRVSWDKHTLALELTRGKP